MKLTNGGINKYGNQTWTGIDARSGRKFVATRQHFIAPTACDKWIVRYADSNALADRYDFDTLRDVRDWFGSTDVDE